ICLAANEVFDAAAGGCVAIVGPQLWFGVNVTSTYDIKSVHAVVDTIQIDLTPPPSPGAPWAGTADIDSLPRGSKVLTVTATDLLNQTATITARLFHDDPPVIVVTSPDEPTTARPSLHVAATCRDGDTSDGCVSFQ